LDALGSKPWRDHAIAPSVFVLDVKMLNYKKHQSVPLGAQSSSSQDQDGQSGKKHRLVSGATSYDEGVQALSPPSQSHHQAPVQLEPSGSVGASAAPKDGDSELDVAEADFQAWKAEKEDRQKQSTMKKSRDWRNTGRVFKNQPWLTREEQEREEAGEATEKHVSEASRKKSRDWRNIGRVFKNQPWLTREEQGREEAGEATEKPASKASMKRSRDWRNIGRVFKNKPWLSQEEQEREQQEETPTTEKDELESEFMETTKKKLGVKQWRFDAWVDTDTGKDEQRMSPDASPSVLREVASKTSKMADNFAVEAQAKHEFQHYNHLALEKKVAGLQKPDKLKLYRGRRRRRARVLRAYQEHLTTSTGRLARSKEALSKALQWQQEARSHYLKIEQFEKNASRGGNKKKGPVEETPATGREDIMQLATSGLAMRSGMKAEYTIIRRDWDQTQSNRVATIPELCGGDRTGIGGYANTALTAGTDMGARLLTFGFLGASKVDRAGHHSYMRPSLGVAEDFAKTLMEASRIYKSQAMGSSFASGIYATLVVLKQALAIGGTILGSLALYSGIAGLIAGLTVVGLPVAAVFEVIATVCTLGALGLLGLKVLIDALLMTWSSIAAARAKHRDPRKRRIGKHQAFKNAGDLAADGAGLAVGAVSAGLTYSNGFQANGTAKDGAVKGWNDAGRYAFKGSKYAVKGAGSATKVGIGVGSSMLSPQMRNEGNAISLDVDNELASDRDAAYQVIGDVFESVDQGFTPVAEQIEKAAKLAKGKPGKVGEIGEELEPIAPLLVRASNGSRSL
jgi:hypothetical protein